MSSPTPEQQPTYGAPQQPYGVPQQPSGGQPPVPPQGAPGYPPPGPEAQGYGGAPGYAPPTYGAPGYGVPPAAPQSNGFATAGLILGILPTGILGIIFSILGIVRAGKVGGNGRVRAWIGLVLAVIWTIIWTIFAIGAVDGGVNAAKHVVSCSQLESKVQTLGNQAESDADDPDAYKSDVQQIIDDLNSSAKSESDTKTASDMRKLAKDFQEILDDVDSGTVPASDLESRITADGAAVDADCS